MKELEKQQKEYDESADRHYDLYTPGTNPGGGNGKRPFDNNITLHKCYIRESDTCELILVLLGCQVKTENSM